MARIRCSSARGGLVGNRGAGSAKASDTEGSQIRAFRSLSGLRSEGHSDEPSAVVDANCGSVVSGKCVHDADRVDLAHKRAHISFRRPTEGNSFVRRCQPPACDLAAEDKGDDAASHVLVDAGQLLRLYVQPRLFANLAAKPSPRR
jgi:hypothetical protein